MEKQYNLLGKIDFCQEPITTYVFEIPKNIKDKNFTKGVEVTYNKDTYTAHISEFEWDKKSNKEILQYTSEKSNFIKETQVLINDNGKYIKSGRTKIFF